MTDDRRIPTPGAADLPTFTILVDGTQISPEYQIQAIVVDRAYNRVTSAELVVLDGDPASETFAASSTDDFVPGRKIEIQAGYHSDEQTIFKGVVVRHGLRVYESKPSVLRVECKDEAVKLAERRRTAYFYDSTDAEVIEQLANDAGLQPDVEATDTPHETLVQFYATDWDFIVMRAEANGSLVTTEDGTLAVGPPDPTGDPKLRLTYGGNIIDLEIGTDARSQVAAVQAAAWDPAGQELLEVDSSADQTESPGNLSNDDLAAVIDADPLQLKHAGLLNDAELQHWADGQQAKRDLAKVRGRIRFQGFGGIAPGDVVALDGLGDRFNGSALVAGVRHEIGTRNWVTDITVGLSPDWFATTAPDIVDAPAAGLLPGVSSLQIGVVTTLEDPESEHRIRVRIPMIATTEEGVWARLATLDAGADRGSFFLPEIDDEVIVGFLADDPRYPVVLGMVHSSAHPAPIEASDDNPEKGFVTRSGMRLIWDDEKVVATIQTPGGNSVTLNDDEASVTLADGNDNKVVLDGDGVTIESPGKVVIRADGDVEIEGLNVTATASAQLKGEGGAGAELSSSATTTVKGAIVMVN